jgi:hypothetical protein
MTTTPLQLADVFNIQFQAHSPGEPWPAVMRSVADAIALVLYPDDPSARDRWRADANYSGLFNDPASASASSPTDLLREALTNSSAQAALSPAWREAALKYVLAANDPDIP